MTNNQTRNSPSHNHDIAAPRQRQLICTGARPIHPVYGQPMLLATKAIPRNEFTFSPFLWAFPSRCVMHSFKANNSCTDICSTSVNLANRVHCLALQVSCENIWIRHGHALCWNFWIRHNHIYYDHCATLMQCVYISFPHGTALATATVLLDVSLLVDHSEQHWCSVHMSCCTRHCTVTRKHNGPLTQLNVCVGTAGGCAAKNSLHDACTRLKIVHHQSFHGNEGAAPLHTRAAPLSCIGAHAPQEYVHFSWRVLH